VSEPLGPESSPFDVEIAIAKLKNNKLPGCYEVPAQMIQAGGEILWPEIHKLINCIWSEEEILDQWKESIIIQLPKKGDKTDCSNYRGISLLSTSYKILSSILLSRLKCIRRRNYWA
jgi:hypothetical protein